MKNKLLLTTALVAVISTTNALASGEDTNRQYKDEFVMSEGKQSYDNKNAPENGYYDYDEEDDHVAINYNSIKITGGDLTLTDIDFRSGGDATISEGTINLINGQIKAHEGNLNISGGTINMSDESEVYGKIMTVSGDAVINLSELSAIGGDKELYIQGGTINAKDGIISAGSEDDALLQMSGGTINMENSFLVSEEADHTAGKMQITGGTVNINGGKNVIMASSDAQESYLKGKNTILNIKEGASLYVFEKDIHNDDTPFFDRFTEKGVLNLLDNANLNLGGELNANVNNGANFNVTSNTAKLNGNLAVNNGGVVDLGANKLTVAGDVVFHDNSTLKFTVAGKDKFGNIKANSFNISENGTNLELTLNSNVLGKDESQEFTILDGSVEGEFANLSENSRYEFEKTDKAGVYKITGMATVEDVINDAGGSSNNVSVASAWDSMDLSDTTSTAGKVANILVELSNKATTPLGQKAYVDALTVIAPEVAPMVQQTQSETVNQVLGAVGTRLSVSTASFSRNGMRSVDNPFRKVAVWVQGLFNKSKLDDTGSVKGFDSKTYGTALGIEGKVDNTTKVGVGYAYSKTDIDGFMRDTDVNTHTAVVYGEYKPSQWYVNTIATYGWSDYEEKKNVSGVGVKADYDAETFGLQVMTGYEFKVNGVELTPETGLRYVHIKQDGYKDSAEQKVSANDSDILTGVIGAKVAKKYKLDDGVVVKPEARLAATYDIHNDSVASVVTLANGSAYRVNGSALKRFGWEFGAGVATALNDNVEFSLGYEGRFRKHYEDHTGLINAKYKF